jgi:hypothetical protein
MADNYSFFGEGTPRFYKNRTNVDSDRDYTIDSRNYSQSLSNPLSNVFSSRQSDIDSRNYSQSQTGGSRVFSYRAASGGHATAKIFGNVVMWLMVFGIGYLAYKFLWPIIQKWTHLLKPTVDSTINTADETILRHSSDRMQNGDTYLQSAEWLYSEMFFLNGFIPWWKDADEERIGNYLLTVRKDEFKQLSSTYLLYRREVDSWYQFSHVTTLMSDLKDLFSSSEQSKYLSHLI